MREIMYNREKVLEYAEEWAFKRNPNFLDFEELGGDCTNFASQCIYAGAGVMNPTETFGWYYYSSYERSPSWTGVQYLYNFLTSNKGVGPYAVDVDRRYVREGDLVQLADDIQGFHHSLIVVKKTESEIYLAAHTFDAYMRELSSYYFDDVRYVHIAGVRDY